MPFVGDDIPNPKDPINLFKNFVKGAWGSDSSSFLNPDSIKDFILKKYANIQNVKELPGPFSVLDAEQPGIGSYSHGLDSSSGMSRAQHMGSEFAGYDPWHSTAAEPLEPWDYKFLKNVPKDAKEAWRRRDLTWLNWHDSIGERLPISKLQDKINRVSQEESFINATRRLINEDIDFENELRTLGRKLGEDVHPTPVASMPPYPSTLKPAGELVPNYNKIIPSSSYTTVVKPTPGGAAIARAGAAESYLTPILRSNPALLEGIVPRLAPMMGSLGGGALGADLADRLAADFGVTSPYAKGIIDLVGGGLGAAASSNPYLLAALAVGDLGIHAYDYFHQK